MKRYFLLGLALLLPFVITLFLIIWVVDFLTDPFLSLANQVLLSISLLTPLHLETHELLTLALSRLFTIIFLFLFTFLLGFLANKYIFSYWVTGLQNLFLKIPVVRVIYKLSQDIATSTVSANDPIFQQTVLIPFPHQDSLALGLVTKDIPPSLKKDTELEIAVFVPTSPHPISGFLLLTPKKLIKPVDLSTEDVFKYLISCGSSNPTQGPHV